MRDIHSTLVPVVPMSSQPGIKYHKNKTEKVTSQSYNELQQDLQKGINHTESPPPLPVLPLPTAPFQVRLPRRHKPFLDLPDAPLCCSVALSSTALLFIPSPRTPATSLLSSCIFHLVAGKCVSPGPQSCLHQQLSGLCPPTVRSYTPLSVGDWLLCIFIEA